MMVSTACDWVKSATKPKHMEVAIFLWNITDADVLFFSCLRDESAHGIAGRKKQQISKNSFVCTLNVNGKRFNSFRLFYRNSFLLFAHSSRRVCFTGKMYLFEVGSTIIQHSRLSTTKRMKWVVVNEMEVCTSYLANGVVRIGERFMTQSMGWTGTYSYQSKHNTNRHTLHFGLGSTLLT